MCCSSYHRLPEERQASRRIVVEEDWGNEAISNDNKIDRVIRNICANNYFLHSNPYVKALLFYVAFIFFFSLLSQFHLMKTRHTLFNFIHISSGG